MIGVLVVLQAASRGRGVVARGRAGGPPGMPQRGRGTPSRGGANNGGTRGKANNNNATRGATTAAAKEAAAAKSAGPSLPGEDGLYWFLFTLLYILFKFDGMCVPLNVIIYIIVWISFGSTRQQSSMHFGGYFFGIHNRSSQKAREKS